MSHIVHLRKLERLVLTGGFSDCGLAYLGELKELTSVHLVQCGKIMGKGLRALATLPVRACKHTTIVWACAVSSRWFFS